MMAATNFTVHVYYIEIYKYIWISACDISNLSRMYM